MATWGPNSEELALLDATAGGTELPAGLAPAAVPVVAVVAVPAVDTVPVVLDAEALPVAGLAVEALPVAGLAVEALPVVPAVLAPAVEAAAAGVALPAVAAEVPAVPLVAPAAVVLTPAAVVPVLELGAVTAEPVVVAAAVPA